MSDEKDVDGERLVIRYNTKADMNRSEVAEQAVRAALKLYGIECRKPVIVLGAKPERILASDVHEVFSDGNADTKIAPGTVTAGASWELENDPGVEWRQHPEFHQYEVSDDGRVRVKARLVTPLAGRNSIGDPLARFAFMAVRVGTSVPPSLQPRSPTVSAARACSGMRDVPRPKACARHACPPLKRQSTGQPRRKPRVGNAIGELARHRQARTKQGSQ